MAIVVGNRSCHWQACHQLGAEHHPVPSTTGGTRPADEAPAGAVGDCRRDAGAVAYLARADDERESYEALRDVDEEFFNLDRKLATALMGIVTRER